MVPVTWAVAVGTRSLTPPSLATPPHTCGSSPWPSPLVLIGSTLHVKSLIRERANAGFRRLSRVFAVLSLLASLGLAAWWGLPGRPAPRPALRLASPDGPLAMRGPSPRPGRIGVIELVGFLLLVGCAAIAQAVGAS